MISASAQSRIVSAAQELVASGPEHALQISVVRGGEELVAVAAGNMDGPSSDTIASDSLFPVFSVSKGVTALAAYRAVDRGAIDFDTRVADVWPEFAAQGKSDIRFHELLDHTAGLSTLPEAPSLAEFLDWEGMTAKLAAAAPEGRGTPGYHGLTYGWLVGETVRRALGTARGFGAIVRDELFEDAPSDFWFGIPDDVEHRIVTVTRDAEPTNDGSPLQRAIPLRFATTQEVYGNPEVRRACLPGVNGIGNAVALATLYSRAASGDLVSPSVMSAGLALRSHEQDRIMGSFVARGCGFYVSAPSVEWSSPFTSDARTFGHPGAGGSIAWGDLHTGTGFAICRGALTRDGWRNPNIQRLISLVSEATLAR